MDFAYTSGTPDESGIDLGAVEHLGTTVMKEIAENIRRNHVTPNPLTKAGPIVVTDQTANEKVGGISQVSEKTRIVGRETSLEKN